MNEAIIRCRVLKKSMRVEFEAAFRAGLSDQSDAQDYIQRRELCADGALTFACMLTYVMCAHSEISSLGFSFCPLFS